MPRSLKILAVVLLSFGAYFCELAVAYGDDSEVTRQEQMINNEQLVQLGNQNNDAAQDPILSAITQAKYEVKQVKATKVNNMPQGATANDVAVNADPAPPNLQPNYTVIDLATSATNHNKNYGPTKKSDHLWQIARQVSPRDACTVSQTALAIFAANPEAFNNNNINGLKYGYVLKIPSEALILKVSPKAASQIIIAQNRSWQGMDESSSSERHAGVRKNQRFSSSVAAKMYAAKVRRLAAQEKMPIVAQRKIVTTPKVASVKTLIKKPVEATTVASFDLENRVTKLESDTQNFRQVVGMHITNLANQDANLQSQLLLMENNFQIMQATLTRLQQRQQQLEQYSVAKIAINMDQLNTKLMQQFGRTLYIGLVIGILLLLVVLLLWLVWPKNRRQAYHADENYELKAPEVAEGGEAEAETSYKNPLAVPDLAKDEYDFLAGPEGMTTKLDLARVYIDMGDKEKAREFLNEVVEKGDAAQKQTATELLAKI